MFLFFYSKFKFMAKSNINTAFFLFCFMAFSIQISSTIGERLDIDHKQEEKQSFKKILQNSISLLKTSHQNSWKIIKTIMHEIQLKYFPPNLDFKGSNTAGGGAGGKMKNAVGKSFDTSKQTAEGTAKSAAVVVGKTMDNTAKKVKGSVAEEESKAEL